MTEQEFWQIIELSWQDSPYLYKKRTKVLETNDEDLLTELSEEVYETITENCKNRLQRLDRKALTAFILLSEEKLYKIDREEIHKFTDGSDDGFLYCRCFILGMGEQYFNMIDKEPAKATIDLEAEAFGFAGYEVFEEKFGEEFERNTVCCIESCSNKEAWSS
ncbi:MAG: DUF4240 domain-containing protein [Acidobacteriota bacterium]